MEERPVVMPRVNLPKLKLPETVWVELDYAGVYSIVA